MNLRILPHFIFVWCAWIHAAVARPPSQEPIYSEPLPAAPRAEKVERLDVNGSAVVATTNSMEVLENSRRLSPGDRISYRVVEERKAPLQLVITDSGEVEVPLIGRVIASGRTCRELAYSVKPLLERDYFHRATVIVGLDMITPRPAGRVYITGQVRAQGAVDLPADQKLTLSKAILRAGGFGEFANKKKIKLVRRNATGQARTTIINIEPVLKGDLDKDVVLEPDDEVIVSERFFNF